MSKTIKIVKLEDSKDKGFDQVETIANGISYKIFNIPLQKLLGACVLFGIYYLPSDTN